MASSKVNIDDLSLEIIKELDAYQDVTQEIVESAVKRAAKETAKELRERAEAAFPRGSGEYAESWDYKRDGSLSGKKKFSMVVYAKAPGYRLAHLLEHGHLTRNGRRTPGRAHIAPAEKLAREKLEFYIKSGVAQDGGRIM